MSRIGKRCWTLFSVYGMTCRSIDKVLGCVPGTARKYVTQAWREL